MSSAAVTARSAVPLVFVHGHKGSDLIATTGSRSRALYLRWWHALGLSTPDISLPMKWGEDGRQLQDNLRPGQPMLQVCGRSVYGPLVRALGSVGQPFYSFTYDWRRELNETLHWYEQFLEETIKRHSGQRVQVVAHSLGGLLTYRLWLQRPELFHSVVLVAAPFKPGVGFLPDLEHGCKMGLNKKLLRKEVVFTHPSSFSFFAPNAEEVSVYTDKEGNVVPLNLTVLNTWKDYRIGLFQNPTTPEFDQHVVNCMEHDRTFWLGLHELERRVIRDASNPGVAATLPPIVAVVGTGHPSIGQVIIDGPMCRGTSRLDFESGRRVDGDGRIPTQVCVPPEGIPFQARYIMAGHMEIVTKVDFIRAAIDEIFSGKPSSSGTGSGSAKSSASGVVKSAGIASSFTAADASADTEGCSELPISSSPVDGDDPSPKRSRSNSESSSASSNTSDHVRMSDIVPSVTRPHHADPPTVSAPSHESAHRHSPVQPAVSYSAPSYSYSSSSNDYSSSANDYSTPSNNYSSPSNDNSSPSGDS